MADPVRVALVTGRSPRYRRRNRRRVVRSGLPGRRRGLLRGRNPNRPTGVDYPLATAAQLDNLADRHPTHVVTRIVDVRDGDALRAAAHLAVETFGRLDAAVAAAAVIVGGQPPWQTPPENLRTLLDVDVIGVWNTAAACVRHMRAGPDPSNYRFVAITSTGAHTGLFHLTGYTATKHAVVGIVRGLAADLVATGVTAVAVSPARPAPRC